MRERFWCKVDKRRIPCPKCVQEYRIDRCGKKTTNGPFLSIDETNYHGSGEDLASCAECDGEFFISYKVDKIIECEW